MKEERMEQRRAQLRLAIQVAGFGLMIITKESDHCTGLLQAQRVAGG
jgi:hypothetical protein